MATIYVRSGAGGANNGTSWTDAYTTLQAALTAWTTADVIWVAKDSNESFAATTTWTCAAATVTSPCLIVSVDHTDDTYAPKAGTNQIADSDWEIFTFAFHVYMYGMSIHCNRILQFNGSGQNFKAIDCKFSNTYGTATSLARLTLGGTSTATSSYRLKNCDYTNTTDTYVFVQAAHVTWEGGQIYSSADTAGSGIVTLSTQGCSVDMIGCDFSSFTGANYLASLGSNAASAYIAFRNCLLPGSVGLLSALPSYPFQRVSLISSDSAGDNGRIETWTYAGDVISTSSVYDNAIQVQYTSGEQHSLELTPSANCTKYKPLYTDVLIDVAETTGSKTFTVEVAHNYASSLKDTDLWMDLIYGGTASSTLKTLDSSMGSTGTRDVQTAGSTLATSTATWTGAGGLTLQKISLTETINSKGPVYARIYLGTYAASKSVYVSPHVGIA